MPPKPNFAHIGGDAGKTRGPVYRSGLNEPVRKLPIIIIRERPLIVKKTHVQSQVKLCRLLPRQESISKRGNGTTLYQPVVDDIVRLPDLRNMGVVSDIVITR